MFGFDFYTLRIVLSFDAKPKKDNQRKRLINYTIPL